MSEHRDYHDPDRLCAHGVHNRDHCQACIDEGVVSERTSIPGMGGWTDGETQAVPVEYHESKKRGRGNRHSQRTPLPGDKDYAPRLSAERLRELMEGLDK